MILRRIEATHLQKPGRAMLMMLCLLAGTFLAPAMAQSASAGPEKVTFAFDSPEAGGSDGGADPHAAGSISGTVVDQQGAVAGGAHVVLTPADAVKQEVLSGDNGQFSFSNIAPGLFQLSVSAPGFDTQISSGTLRPGGVFLVPTIVLHVAVATTDVQVTLPQIEVAEQEVKDQEQQRVLGFIPNMYVSYVPDAAPLVPRLKFQLAWKSVSNPITIMGAGFLAGMYQAADQFPGYGQGAEGYFKRFGAAYGDVLVGTFVGSAALPSLFKQDPRYFYKGTGTIRSRFIYAVSNAVICRGDNKQRQINYSGILGAFVSGGVSYMYYPASDRSGELVLQNSLIRIAEGSVAGLVQEFVIKRFTSGPRVKQAPGHP